MPVEYNKKHPNDCDLMDFQHVRHWLFTEFLYGTGIVRREQLKNHKYQEHNRLDKCDNKIIQKSIKKLITFIEKEMTEVEKALNKHQQSCVNINKR
jgi:hypothetical protein